MIDHAVRAQHQSSAARRGDRLVLHIEGRRGRRAVAQADSPGPSVGLVGQGPDLAGVDQGMFEAQIPQQLSQAVGDKALSDAIERDRHAGARQRDGAGRNLNLAIIDQCQSRRDFGWGWGA